MPIDDRSYKRLTKENVDRSPRKRGVYALYEERRLVFLGQASGRSDTIRSRLRSHLAAAKKGITRYKRESAKAPAARLRQLLAEHVKKHGTPPSLNAVGGSS
jgi:hypothetical protein